MLPALASLCVRASHWTRLAHGYDRVVAPSGIGLGRMEEINARPLCEEIRAY